MTSDGPIYSETIPVTENPYAIRILGTNYNGAVTLEALQYAVNQAIRYGGSGCPRSTTRSATTTSRTTRPACPGTGRSTT